MDGPNVAWYIAVAAVLFGIGAVGGVVLGSHTRRATT
jgi:hypothetical protein